MDWFRSGREGTCTAACYVLEKHFGKPKKKKKKWGCLNGKSGTEHKSLKTGFCDKDKKSEANTDRFVILRYEGSHCQRNAQNSSA